MTSNSGDTSASRTQVLRSQPPMKNSLSTNNSTIAPSLLSLPCRAQLNCQPSTDWIQVKVKVMLRPMVSRPVCLGVNHQSGAYDQIFITVRQLQVCWCGVLSLTRERVYHLQLLLVLGSAVMLGSKSHGTHDHILLSQIRDSPYLEGQVPILISSRNRVAQLYPQALSSRFVTYDSQGYVEVFERTSTHSFPRERVYRDVAQKRPFVYSPVAQQWLYLLFVLKSLHNNGSIRHIMKYLQTTVFWIVNP
jgi:hypothetical protein